MPKKHLYILPMSQLPATQEQPEEAQIYQMLTLE